MTTFCRDDVLPCCDESNSLVAEGEDDFAEVAAGLHVGEGFVGLGEGEGAVDDGVDVVGFEGCVETGAHAAAADVDAVEMDGLGEDGRGVDAFAFAAEDADEVDVAAGGDGVEGAGEGAGAADFDDVVDAALVGELEDLAIPVGGGAVVDGFVGSEGAAAG